MGWEESGSCPERGGSQSRGRRRGFTYVSMKLRRHASRRPPRPASPAQCGSETLCAARRRSLPPERSTTPSIPNHDHLEIERRDASPDQKRRLCGAPLQQPSHGPHPRREQDTRRRGHLPRPHRARYQTAKRHRHTLTADRTRYYGRTC